MFRRGVLVLGLFLIATWVASGPAMADSTDTFTIIASGAGANQSTVEEVGVQLTGTFQFSPATLVVSNVLLDASLTSVGSAGTSFTECWAFGPLTASANGPNGWDVINFSGDVGSLGDVLDFQAYMFPDASGGFVPSIGQSGILSGSPATVQLNYLDGWAGEITPAPVPEPGTWMLLAVGLLVLGARLCRR
jgi:PEP-CTERM motif